MEWPSLGWVDLAMLAVVAISAVIGLVRGFTFEMLSLAGWFFAFFAARWLEPWLGPYLPVGAPGSLLNRGAAFACAFLAVLIVWSLLARGAAALIGKTPLRPLDRLFGAAFGVLRTIGPAKAAYSSVIVPVIAMCLSTIFEGYRWSGLAVAGAVLAAAGLVVALRARRPNR